MPARNAYPTRRRGATIPLLSGWVDEFLEYCALLGETPNTIAGRRTVLKRFAEWHDMPLHHVGILDPREMSSETVVRFWRHIAGEVSSSSQESYRRQLHKFLTWTMSHPPVRIGPYNPTLLACIEKPRKGPEREYVYLSAVQLSELVESANNPYDRAALAVMVDTLCRRSTAVLLRVGDIDLERRKVTLINKKSHSKKLVQELTPSFEREMRRWFEEYSIMIGRNLEPDDYVIPHRAQGGGRLDPKQAIKVANLTPLVGRYTKHLIPERYDGGPHALRRSAAQALLDALLAAGVPLMQALSHVQALLGHAHVTTTLGYLHTTYAELDAQEALRKLGSFRPDLSTVPTIGLAPRADAC